MIKFFERIRNFGLYINGRRTTQGGLSLSTNPFSGRVIGRVFLTPQESLLYHELTPTLEELTPTEEVTAPMGLRR
ncbi:MAG: hypothetical protein JNK65_10160 [Deltaproteobacteria bacterium]|nr:hypothetical protein [Deltaproteobacteria bacterium]